MAVHYTVGIGKSPVQVRANSCALSKPELQPWEKVVHNHLQNLTLAGQAVVVHGRVQEEAAHLIRKSNTSSASFHTLLDRAVIPAGNNTQTQALDLHVDFSHLVVHPDEPERARQRDSSVSITFDVTGNAMTTSDWSHNPVNQVVSSTRGSHIDIEGNQGEGHRLTRLEEEIRALKQQFTSPALSGPKIWEVFVRKLDDFVSPGK